METRPLTFLSDGTNSKSRVPRDVWVRPPSPASCGIPVFMRNARGLCFAAYQRQSRVGQLTGQQRPEPRPETSLPPATATSSCTAQTPTLVFTTISANLAASSRAAGERRAASGEPFDRSYLYKVVNDAGKSAGIEWPPVGLHTLTHSAPTIL